MWEETLPFPDFTRRNSFTKCITTASGGFMADTVGGQMTAVYVYTQTVVGGLITKAVAAPNNGLNVPNHLYFQNLDIAAIAANMPAPNPNARLSLTEIQAILTEIDGLSFADYRMATNHPKWQQLYRVANRKLKYHPYNDGPNELTAPCQYCGLLLPMDLLEVDHQKPKASGKTDWAILKVLHTIRPAGFLTVGAAHGQKNTQLQNITGAAVPAAVTPANRARAAWADRQFNTLPQAKQDRYTLAPRGKVLMALANKCFWNDLEERCVNNILNLVPACPRCNKTKSSMTFPT